MARPKHGYQLADGSEVPGTTTILNRWKDSGGLLIWAWQRGKQCPNEPLYAARDEAADVGSYVHALIEADIDHADPPEPKGLTEEQAEQGQQAFGAFMEWADMSRLTIVRKEMPLVCEHHRFGGTPDAWAMIGDKLALLDWKSSKGLYYDYAIQLAAYRHLHEDHFPGEKITAIHIIRFGKSGCDFTHRYFRADHPALAKAWRQFQLMREAYDLDRDLKKLAS